MRKFVCKPLPGDASDPQGLTALVGPLPVVDGDPSLCLGHREGAPRDPRALPPLVPGAEHHAAPQRDARDARAVPAAHLLLSPTQRPAAEPLEPVASAHVAAPLVRLAHQAAHARARSGPRPGAAARGTASAAPAALRRRSGSGPRAGRPDDAPRPAEPRDLGGALLDGAAARGSAAAGAHGSGPRAPHAPGAPWQGEERSLRAHRPARLAWIDKYLAEARPLLARHAETPLVFVSKNGHRLHANQLSKIVRDYLRGAGIAKPARAIYFDIRQRH